MKYMNSFHAFIILVSGWVAVFGALPKAAFTAAPLVIQSQAPEPAIPLEGLDPVFLTQGKEVIGKASISVTRGRFKYLFANEENKAVFAKDPERYEIQLDGSCARMGPQTGGNPDLFTVYEGRIYLLGSNECLKRFEAAP